MMTIALGGLAIATDLGSVYYESRRLQGIADAAALSAVADLSRPDASARAAIDANGWDRPVDARVETGRYSPDPTTAWERRFAVTAAAPDAARVTLTSDARLFFGSVLTGQRTFRISRTATAARTDLASFAIGSRLAALDGGLANALLGGLTGSSVSLSVMDYQALLSADVDLFAFLGALRTTGGVRAASFDELLATDLSSAQVLGSLATVLGGQDGGVAAAATVRRLLSQISGSERLRLGELIDLGPIGGQDRAAPGQAIMVNAGDLVRMLAEAAGGERQVRLDLGASVPGLAQTTVWLAIGDRMADSPWLTVTAKGEPVIRTAQTRLYIETTLAGSGALRALGIASVRLPLLLELAEAEAKLDAIECRGAFRSVRLLARTSIGHVSIADIDRTRLADHRSPLDERPATIVALPLIAVTGMARVDLNGSAWRSVSFSAEDIAGRRIRSISSDSIVQGIAASLAERLNLAVQVGGLGLGAGQIGSLVGSVITPAAPALDALVNNLLDLLGLKLGQADLRINGVRCGQAALVG